LEAAKNTLAAAMGAILKTHGSLACMSRFKGMHMNHCMMPLLLNNSFMLQNVELYNKKITKCACVAASEYLQIKQAIISCISLYFKNFSFE
jgi:hypothetical protein